MKLQTLRTINKCMPVASKDKTRLYLNGVNVRSHATYQDTVIVEATDSHALIQYEIQDESLAIILRENDNHLIISNDTLNKASLKSILKACKDYEANADFIDISITDSSIQLHIRYVGSFSLSTVKKDFPRTDTLIPKPKDIYNLSFNYDILKRLVDSLEFDKRAPKLITFKLDKSKITVDEAEKVYVFPIKVATKGKEELTALLMPVIL